MAFVVFAAQTLQLLDNWPKEANSKHIRAINLCRSNALKAPAKVNVFTSKRLKTTVVQATILHKDLVANFHKLAAVARWMREAIAFGVVLRTKIIKYFAVRTTRVANWGFIESTAS
ncbi:hypothetical protein D9M69_591250 [compost metagenome]